MIDYRNDLNPAQFEAATALGGPLLVIAGAGSGKTRTIVYRLARLVESGVPASSILLLTFTRKAAQEMLDRARLLMRGHGMAGLKPGLDADLSAVQGGTFHAYAYSVLRLFAPEGYGDGQGKRVTVMDSHDILAALQHCREQLKAGKGDRSFPKNQTINALVSKSRNKELPLETVMRREASHLLPHVEAMEGMAGAYAVYKREKSLLDYDDLLFELERALVSRPEVLAYCRRRHQYIMVDEYQDTNPVQARIAALVAGLDPAFLAGWSGEGSTLACGQEGDPPASRLQGPGNIMVVGDDAQSIYAFRGADVRNILRFPELFPGAKLVRLEENYRSTQPLLDLSNAVLEHAAEGFSKRLFTRREGSLKPSIVRPLSDRSQADLVTARIIELLRLYPAGEIAVLFRSGFHSYALEVALNKIGVAFRKYGGIRYTEAAHVKDVMSFVRLVLNPLDYIAFTRMAELSKGVGAKTCHKLYQLALAGNAEALAKAAARYEDLMADMAFVDRERRADTPPAALLARVVEHYRPRLESLYPDDYPKRLQGLEQLVQIAGFYTDLDLLVADLSLEDPAREEETRDTITLSTIHSAKGLEWSAVIILDLVEERFPSRHAMLRPEDYEEERRLMYVACTRAKEFLELYVPATMYDKGGGGRIPAVPSPFVRELGPALYDEWQEGYTGGLVKKEARPAGPAFRGEGAFGRPAAFGRNAVVGESAAFSGREEGEPEQETERERWPDQDSGEGVFSHRGATPVVPPSRCGHCRHRVFGRGKIVQHLPPDKYRVNFPGFGLKVIMADYLSLEEE